MLISDQINNIHTKLDNAEDSRILAFNENQAQHEALVSLCIGSGHLDPFEDYDEITELDDDRSITPQSQLIIIKLLIALHVPRLTSIPSKST